MAKSLKKRPTSKAPAAKARKIAATSSAPKPRENTKQSKLIAMLRRSSGATIDDLAKATGWQRHTVRGAISGALKKKLGLTVTSNKTKDGERVYRIAL
jgi:DNA-binding XRE family transcriptional regulator